MEWPKHNSKTVGPSASPAGSSGLLPQDAGPLPASPASEGPLLQEGKAEGFPALVIFNLFCPIRVCPQTRGTDPVSAHMNLS